MTRRLSGRDQEGTTVTEMVVVTALLAMVLATAFSVLISLQNASQGTTERGINLSEGRLLMDQVTKDLRTATRLTADASPFISATPTDVTFYANVNVGQGPNKVRLYTDASQRLVEQLTSPDSSSVPPDYTYTGAAQTRFVGRYLTNGATNPPLTYLDDSGIALPLDASCGCLSGQSLLRVRAVGITLSVRHSTSLKVAPTTLVNRVRLPNLDYNEQGSA